MKNFKTKEGIYVDDVFFSIEEIAAMDSRQLKDLCSFLLEGDLLFVQKHCNEDLQYIIDNILMNAF